MNADKLFAFIRVDPRYPRAVAALQPLLPLCNSQLATRNS